MIFKTQQSAEPKQERELAKVTVGKLMMGSKPSFAIPNQVNLDYLGAGLSPLLDAKSDDRKSKMSPKWSRESQALSNRVQQTYGNWTVTATMLLPIELLKLQ